MRTRNPTRRGTRTDRCRGRDRRETPGARGGTRGAGPRGDPGWARAGSVGVSRPDSHDRLAQRARRHRHVVEHAEAHLDRAAAGALDARHAIVQRVGERGYQPEIAKVATERRPRASVIRGRLHVRRTLHAFRPGCKVALTEWPSPRPRARVVACFRPASRGAAVPGSRCSSCSGPSPSSSVALWAANRRHSGAEPARCPTPAR
jgi:hypothetical protein